MWLQAQHRELQSAANSTDEQRLSAAIAAASDFVEGRANVHRHDEVAAVSSFTFCSAASCPLWLGMVHGSMNLLTS